MSSPQYLSYLDELEPPSGRIDYTKLMSAWDDIIEDPNSMDRFFRLAEVAFMLIALDIATYRVENDLGGAWEQVIGDAKDLHERKNKGYTGGADDPWLNFRECEAFGVPAHTGVLVRMSDKYIRITNLLRDPDNDQVNESILDTLADLAAYAIIYICIWEEGS